MIPIGDRLRTRTVPWVNYGLIAINFVAFFYELTLSTHPQAGIVRGFVHVSPPPRDVWIERWGLIPHQLADFLSAPGSHDWRVLERLITSQFIHAGWLHILGNMIFLWVFGDNVEDALGHVRYLLFYLLCGVIAALTQVFFTRNALGPLVGASGAIAGVLGSYLVLYPGAAVSVIIPIVIIPFFTRVPAWLVMIVWFVTQLISLAPTANATGGNGGVAYAAHIGGFVAGFLLVRLAATRRRSLPG
ncbi:MAG TPA: rhomboid family intramembrane serine protease [Dehalococcoidia bacterium]|nr:rhomboid family intramembrane serine protease [Dehalococcoidia bacterium]